MENNLPLGLFLLILGFLFLVAPIVVPKPKGSITGSFSFVPAMALVIFMRLLILVALVLILIGFSMTLSSMTENNFSTTFAIVCLIVSTPMLVLSIVKFSSIRNLPNKSWAEQSVRLRKIDVWSFVFSLGLALFLGAILVAVLNYHFLPR